MKKKWIVLTVFACVLPLILLLCFFFCNSGLPSLENIDTATVSNIQTGDGDTSLSIGELGKIQQDDLAFGQLRYLLDNLQPSKKPEQVEQMQAYHIFFSGAFINDSIKVFVGSSLGVYIQAVNLRWYTLKSPNISLEEELSPSLIWFVHSGEEDNLAIQNNSATRDIISYKRKPICVYDISHAQVLLELKAPTQEEMSLVDDGTLNVFDTTSKEKIYQGNLADFLGGETGKTKGIDIVFTVSFEEKGLLRYASYYFRVEPSIDEN